MEILHSFTEIDKTIPLSLAFGYFDGIHLGHMEIIKETNKQLKNGVVTFDKHPLDLVCPDNAPKRLMTLDEKIKTLKTLNVDYLFIIPFDEDFRNLSDTEFLDMICDNVNMKKMKVGFNYHFGKNGHGNPEMLKRVSKEKGFELEVVEEYKIDGLTVSSTRIRNLIKEGQISKANKLLDKHYEMSGKVFHGKHLGKTIGIPTANIYPNKIKVVPKRGVYVTRIIIDEEIYYGITNVGINPTFNEKPRIETNIFDFNKDIYNKEITVEFLEFEREERAFDSIEELKETVKKSICFGREYIKANIS